MCQFLAGGTAGVVQWLPPFFCFDVIKSRMQTSPPHYYKGDTRPSELQPQLMN